MIKLLFFGLYDVHGGTWACDFMRDNLINDKYFPSNRQKDMTNQFIYVEKLYFKNYTGIDPSGSFVIIIILIIENRVYIVNVLYYRANLMIKIGTQFNPFLRE